MLPTMDVCLSSPRRQGKKRLDRRADVHELDLNVAH